MDGKKKATHSEPVTPEAPSALRPIRLQPFETDYETFVSTTRRALGMTGEQPPKVRPHKRILSLMNLESLTHSEVSWEEFLREDCSNFVGSEHYVEKPAGSRFGAPVAKITVPPKFGLVPAVLRHPRPHAAFHPGSPAFRSALEFVPATPLEYLDRWIAANILFGDDARLTSVIRWPEGTLSFGVTQPQYNGRPAEILEIESFFEAAGWTRIPDPSEHAAPPGHTLFFHYALEVLAIDVQPRNCYVSDGVFLPFDVILCHPGPELEEFLRLY